MQIHAQNVSWSNKSSLIKMKNDLETTGKTPISETSHSGAGDSTIVVAVVLLHSKGVQ